MAMAEFQAKIPEMFGILQKHVKDGHINGSDGVSGCVFVSVSVCKAAE